MEENKERERRVRTKSERPNLLHTYICSCNTVYRNTKTGYITLILFNLFIPAVYTDTYMYPTPRHTLSSANTPPSHYFPNACNKASSQELPARSYTWYFPSSSQTLAANPWLRIDMACWKYQSYRPVALVCAIVQPHSP